MGRHKTRFFLVTLSDEQEICIAAEHRFLVIFVAEARHKGVLEFRELKPEEYARFRIEIIDPRKKPTKETARKRRT